MAETIKITDEELAEVRSLQIKAEERVFNLGRLYLDKMNIEDLIKVVTDKETKIREDLKNSQTQENEFIERLLKKYGEGQLDMKSGTFIKDK